MISKLSDVPDLQKRALADLGQAIPRIRTLAASSDWKEREVAATVLVVASKRNPMGVVRAMNGWADDADANVRRAASESLRGLARCDPEAVLPILNKLKEDESLYVRKSVASILRNASGRHADFVLRIAREWMAMRNPKTHWIIKEGLKKLRVSRRSEVERLIGALDLR